MDLDELRTVRRTEREKDSLQHLRDSFYEDVAAYLSDLEARRDRAAAEADDPFASTDVRKLTDKIETAEEVSEAIYERRVGKIVKQASFAAAGMSADRGGLTDQEAELYDDIVARIKENKSTVLDILAGEDDAGSSSAPSSPAGETAAGDGAVTAALGGDTTTPESTGADQPATDAASRDVTDESPDRSPAEPIPAGGVDGGESATSTVPEESTAASESDGMLADAMGSPGESPDGQDSAEQNPAEPSSSDQVPTDSGTAHAAQPAESDVTTDLGVTDDDGSPADGDEHTPTTDGGATQLQRTTVRITQDVGEIFGVDEREYTLEREDVVTLPTTNAEPLVERDAAEPLE